MVLEGCLYKTSKVKLQMLNKTSTKIKWSHTLGLHSRTNFCVNMIILVYWKRQLYHN